MHLNRRALLALAATQASADPTKPKLLLPSDQPDEHSLKLMWYNPVPPINQATWRLAVRGLVEKPQALPVAQLRALPQETQSSRMKCVQCWSARAKWTGFRGQSLLDIVKPTKKAKAVRFDCADKWYEYFTIEDLLQKNVLFVLDLAGKPLPDKHGAPLRLLDPSRYGYKSAKLITSITFVEEGKGSMACDIGPYYSPDGRILPGYDTPLDLGGKVKRKISGGEILDY
ncbi:MAG: molybdopterin-dependent oxidoreductase [Bryobacteraceae bacterium]|nr:molybdopterin-dependent oxidoreductase [Bryobacteraceae bacterium]